jgi:thioredoxin-like negative regulator of GroEL
MRRPQLPFWTMLGILATVTTTGQSGAFHITPPRLRPQRRALHRKQQRLTVATMAASSQSNDDNRPAQSKSLKFKNFDNMLDAYSNEPILVYFTSLSCGPCRLQTKELRSAMSDAPWTTVLAIDTERFPHVGTRYDIAKLPCLLLLVNGQVLHRLEGLTLAHDVVEQFYAKINDMNQHQPPPPPPPLAPS